MTGDLAATNGAGDVYRQLQQHLDRLPQRFPATVSGVELRILARLFSPDAARLALELSAVPEPVSTIHGRVRDGGTPDELQARLEGMAARGLILELGSGAPRFALLPFVVGIYEHQLPTLSADLERDVLQYFEEGFGQAVATKKTTQMRTVPVNTRVVVDRDVATYDDIRAFVRASEGPFAVMDCICRLGKSLVDEPCRQTSRMQTCLTFGPAAKGMAESGAAHVVTREEMLALLDEADRDGLVLQPENTQAPLFVCCCCGCCCGVLTNAKRLPAPAEYFSTNYYADVDEETCEACGTCLTRCQMDAVSLETGKAVIARTHCIGCGLCIETCQPGAMTLRRLEHERRPPSTTPALYLQQFRDRYGVLGVATAFARHLLGRKV